MLKHHKGSVSWTTVFIITWMLFLGFLPATNLLWSLFFVSTLFLPFSWRFLLLIAPAKLVLPLLDPLLEPLGYHFLNLEPLRPLFTNFANLPLLSFSGYNSSLVATAFLLLPLFFIFSWLLYILLAKPLKAFYEKMANNFIFSRIQSVKNLPRALRHPLSFKKMQRWLQELPHDRELEHLAFFAKEENSYKLKDGLSKPQLRQLNRLYKQFQMKRLRRYSTLSILLLLFIVSAWINWKKDAFLTRTLERSLGKLNGAQVDLKGFHLSLLQASLKFDELAFSNPRQPQENSFQTGRTVIDLDSRELWLGRINIVEISSQSLLVKQPRIKAGVVYENETTQTKEKGKSFTWELPLQTKEVSKLIEEELEKLDSQKLLNELVAEYQTRIKVWENKKDDYQQQASSLISKTKEQLQKVPSLTNLENLNLRIKESKVLWQQLQSLIKQGGNDLNAIAAEREASELSWNILRSQISADASSLAKKITELGDLEKLFSFLQNFLEEELKSRISNPYLIKAYDFVQERNKKNQQKTTVKKKRPERKVSFLRQEKPFFYIETIYLDSGDEEPFYLEAHHLSNQPQLVSETMQFSWGKEFQDDTLYQGDAQIDLRSNKIEANLNTDFLNFPLSLKSELPPLDYQGLQNSSLKAHLAEDGWINLNYEGYLKPLNIARQTDDFNDILNAILNSDTLEIHAQIRTNFRQFEFLTLESNIAEVAITVLEDHAGQLFKNLENKILTELEQILQEQWSQKLLLPFKKSLTELGEDFSDITGTLNSEVNLLDDNNNSLEKTTADLSKKLNQEITKNLEKPTKEVEKEVKKLGEDLSKKLKKDNPLKKLF